MGRKANNKRRKLEMNESWLLATLQWGMEPVKGKMGVQKGTSSEDKSWGGAEGESRIQLQK